MKNDTGVCSREISQTVHSSHKKAIVGGPYQADVECHLALMVSGYTFNEGMLTSLNIFTLTSLFQANLCMSGSEIVTLLSRQTKFTGDF